MNGVDWIVGIVAGLAVWNGWRRGAIVQLCSLIGIVLGIWLAWRTGAAVGGWMGLDERIARPAGFVTVLLLTIVSVALAARVMRKLSRAAGLGALDVVLGIVFALAKYLLILSVLFRAFDRIDADRRLVSARTLDHSIAYRPVMRFSEAVLPFVSWAEERISAERTEEE